MSKSLINRGIAEKSLKNLKPFQKGQSGNPKGKEKGTADFMVQLKTAIHTLEKEKGISIIEFAVREAYTNPQVLISMIKKILPDISKSDVKVESSVYSKFESEFENMSIEEIVKETEKALDTYKRITADNSHTFKGFIG